MTEHINFLKLTRKLQEWYVSKHFILECCRCEKALKTGQRIVSKRKIGKSPHKFYHRGCWEGMFY